MTNVGVVTTVTNGKKKPEFYCYWEAVLGKVADVDTASEIILWPRKHSLYNKHFRNFKIPLVLYNIQKYQPLSLAVAVLHTHLHTPLPDL